LTWSTHRKERTDFRQEGKTMTNTKSNKMKKLAAAVTMTFVLGGGATAVLLPTFASATVASRSSDDPASHVKGSDDGPMHAKGGKRADDAPGLHAKGGRRADDAPGLHAKGGKRADDAPGFHA
jgi:hypothetical protein